MDVSEQIINGFSELDVLFVGRIYIKLYMKKFNT